MSFSVKQSTKNIAIREVKLNSAEKTAETIDSDSIRLKEHKGRFIYYPAQTSIECNDIIKSADNYLQDLSLDVLLDRPKYEREEMVYDNRLKKWLMVPESELYKYR